VDDTLELELVAKDGTAIEGPRRTSHRSTISAAAGVRSRGRLSPPRPSGRGRGSVVRMPDIVSPIDGRVAYRFDTLELPNALERLSVAERVQSEWCKTSLEERVSVCARMLECYRSHLDANAEQITRMMGKPLAHARGEFERTMVERTEYLCAIAPRALADLVLPDKPGFTRSIRRAPVGVVLDIAAWNYPLVIAINVIVPAVLAGNAVLVKHASQTALVADQLEQAFREAGAPAGLVQAFPVDHETAAAVIASRRVGYVSFTGSVRGGHEVYRAVARESFIGVGLELGGKDPALVLPDAHLDFTVENLVDGAFYNAGQSCCGIERIYVHEAIHDRFVEAFAAKARELRVGNPLEASTSVGPLVNPAAVEHVRAQVAAARQQGARPVVDEASFEVPDLSPCYMGLVVLDGVRQEMAIMREETFGPAIGIMKVRDEAEGIRLMNDSDYGLTASVWTADADRGAKVAEHVEAGTVYLNRCDYLDPGLAWTGIKDSGFGCSLSELGFSQVTRPKSFHLRTKIG
jgi:acyl-CoA reductase-like NAD-dependent aldehyde dehydrogenase